MENELNITEDLSQCNMILAEKCYNTKENRCKTIEIMFETFNVSSLFIGYQSVLSLYASGRINGVVIDCGYHCTNIVPIYQGLAINSSNKQLNIGGKQLTEYLIKLFSNRGYQFHTTAEKEIVRDTKEKLCFVPEKHEDEWSDSPNVCVQLQLLFVCYTRTVRLNC